MADVDDIGAEWVDRYGPLPVAADGLLALARLRASALVRGISEIVDELGAGARGAPADGTGLPGGVAGQRTGTAASLGAGRDVSGGPGSAAGSDHQRGFRVRHRARP